MEVALAGRVVVEGVGVRSIGGENGCRVLVEGWMLSIVGESGSGVLGVEGGDGFRQRMEGVKISC